MPIVSRQWSSHHFQRERAPRQGTGGSSLLLPACFSGAAPPNALGKRKNLHHCTPWLKADEHLSEPCAAGCHRELTYLHEAALKGRKITFLVVFFQECTRPTTASCPAALTCKGAAGSIDSLSRSIAGAKVGGPFCCMTGCSGGSPLYGFSPLPMGDASVAAP